MHILITGATGMVGEEVVRQAILDPGIDRITALVRRPLELSHAKLEVVVHSDFLRYDGLTDLFRKCDACLWCLGISQT
ncbi:MAG TPA: NAD(P)H-binding protein, partial [Bacteroidota bacterium]|nr:NAD(P)H-binding protein [Bacteroidota bacterium]